MGFEPDTIRAQVERLVRSKTFETSEVHRRLLEYLAEKTLAGEAERLKEYTVGLEAFGKPATYDPKHDSIVRLQTGRLRQKLATYYQSEASGDPVLISLPKGAFRLQFDEPASESNAAPSHNWLALVGRRPVLLSLTAIFAIWAVVATFMLVRLQHQVAPMTDRWTPELERLWAPFLESRRPILICMGTPLFARFPDVGFFRDPKSNDWPELLRAERFALASKALGGRGVLPSYAFTSVGEASAAFQVARLLSTRKADLPLTRSNMLSWQQIVENDVVFIGPPKFNLHLQNAALKRDIVVEPAGVRNLKPQRGEPEFLEDRIQPGAEGETHAVISRLPGLSGVGELLVIAGNASPDTLGAAEWLTQPWRAKELASHLRLPSGEMPKYFQVVIKVAFKQGVPVQSSYVYHHVLTTSGETPAAR